MINIVKQFFSKSSTNNSETVPHQTDHDIRVATCALFVEIARIDEIFTEEEMEKVLSLLKKKYGLAREHAEALIEEADKELEKSVDLWQFAKLINNNPSHQEKIEIIETLWSIVYVDGKMDQHEHYLMNKLKNLLRLTHGQLIDAKIKVKHNAQQTG